MGSNPIIRFELIRSARHRRHYAMRAAFGLLLLYVAWAVYVAWDQWSAIAVGPEKVQVLRNLPRIADLLVLELLWTQGMGILLVVPGLTAGSIAEEDRRGSMLALLASPLSSGSIVLGKLAARLAQVGAALAIGLPVVIPLALLGALDLAVVARAYAMLLTLALFVGSLSLLVAVIVPRPRLALLWTYLVVGGWLLMPAWLAPLAGRAGRPSPWLGVLADGILLSHPLEAASNLWLVSMFRVFHPDALAWAWSGFSRAFPGLVGTELASSVLFLIAASLLLRSRRLESWRWGGRQPAAPPRPAVDDDDPMLWKERYAHVRLSRRAARLAIGLLVVFMLWPLIEPATAAFQEWRASWSDGAGSIWRRGSMNQELRQFSAGLYIIGLAAVAAMAATSVASERERGTWTSLEMTFVTGREVARAKVSGALRAVRGLMIPFVVLWAIGLATGSVHPLGVLASAAGLIVFLRYGAALGVLCSMISPTSGRAIATTAAALFASHALALLFVPLDLIGGIAGTWQAIYLAGVSPFVEWIALVSPVEIHWYRAGQVWDSALGLPGGVWGTRVLLVPGLIRIYLASLLLYTLAASLTIRAAAWVFDAKRPEFRLPARLRTTPRNRISYNTVIRIYNE